MTTDAIAAVLFFVVWWPLTVLGLTFVAGWWARRGSRFSTKALTIAVLVLSTAIALWGSYGAYTAPPIYMETML